MLALNLFAIAFTALGPLLVAIVMLLWQVVARTAGRLHAAQRRRFVEYGPQFGVWLVSGRPRSRLRSRVDPHLDPQPHPPDRRRSRSGCAGVAGCRGDRAGGAQ